MLYWLQQYLCYLCITCRLPVLPIQVWSFVCAYVIILLLFWSPERKLIFKLLSVPAWMALLFHIVTIFGPFRVPIIFSILILITVSVAIGFSETRSSASTDGKFDGKMCLFFVVELLFCSPVLFFVLG